MIDITDLKNFYSILEEAEDNRDYRKCDNSYNVFTYLSIPGTEINLDGYNDRYNYYTLSAGGNYYKFRCRRINNLR